MIQLPLHEQLRINFMNLKRILNIVIIPALFIPCTLIAYANTYQISDYDMSVYSNSINNIYTHPESHAASIDERLIFDSQQFLGKPYYTPESPLGDGKASEFDQNPLYRTDTFDCVTLVDTVIALAESNGLAQFEHNIIKIRYRNGGISYANRDHWFSQVDWNKVNQANGFIKDITYKFVEEDGTPVAKVAKTNINKPNWYRHLLLANYSDPDMLGSIRIIKPITLSTAENLLSQLQQKSQDVQQEKSILSYLPLSALFNSDESPNLFLFSQIPSGSVVEIVRPNWTVPSKKPYGTNLNVSHFGLAIRDSSGQLMFVEASSIYKKVVSIPLISYLQGYIGSSTIKGINVEKIVFPGAPEYRNKMLDRAG